jgi:putative FmdB family regulatory protein
VLTNGVFIVPLYEYQCLPERHTFEVRQGINDEPVATCPVCGGPVRRVIQPVGIVFKGSGFYVNDSRKSSSTAQAAPNTKTADGAADGKPAAKSTEGEGKSDSKPSSAPESKGETAAAS